MKRTDKGRSANWIGTCLMVLGSCLLLAAGIRILLHQLDQHQAAETSARLLAELKEEPGATASPTPTPTTLPTLPPMVTAAPTEPSRTPPASIPEDPDAPGAWMVEEGDVAETTDSDTQRLPAQRTAELVDADTMPQSTEQPDREINGRTYVGTIHIPALEIELPIQSQWDYQKLKETPCYYQGSVLSGDLVLMAHNYDRHFGMLAALPMGESVQFTDIFEQQVDYQLTEALIIDPDHPEKLDEGDWDLTLFTCTEDGLMRVVLRFIRTSA